MAMPPLNKNAPYFVAMLGFERTLLRDALIANDWNIEAAGRTLGITGSHVRTRVNAVGGFEEEDPKRGKKKHAGRENSNPPSQGTPDPDAGPTDSVDGETDPDDAEQGGDRDEASEPSVGAGDEPN